MKMHPITSLSLLTAGVFLANIAAAQETTGVRFEGERPVNRFGLSYRAGFNVSAKFKNAPISGANPGPAQSGVNHNYDNGYNRVDSSGNTGQGACENCTWYWGYQNSSQVSADGRFISFRATGVEAETDGDEDDPQHGAELTYQREIGKLGKAYWGIEGAFSYMSAEFGGNVDLNTINDRYSLTIEGVTVVPPLPPYAGSSQGPGPVISDIPIRSQTKSHGGSRDLETDIYGFRIGPYIEWPFSDKWSVQFSAGLAFASINTDFSYSDASGRGDSDSDSDWNIGAYVSGNIIYSITEKIDVFAGAQFQHLGDYTHEIGNNEAELDLGESLFAVFGIGFSF